MLAENEGMEVGFCDCEYDYDCLPSFYNIKIRTARKEHKCCECGAMIQPREQYHYIAGKWDGCIDTFKTCLPCMRVRKDFCAPLSMLREEIYERLDFDYVTGEDRFDDEE